MKRQLLRMSAIPVILLICLGFGCQSREEAPAAEKQARDDLRLADVPPVVMNGLIARFPKAEIHKWTKESEGSLVVYDIEFTQDRWKFEADIKEDGSIHNWERAITAADLPEAVTRVVEAEYPESTIKEIMEVTIVNGGKDALQGYEIVLETSDMSRIEVMLAPDGTILEEDDRGDEEGQRG
jgi:hypothetical protein